MATEKIELHFIREILRLAGFNDVMLPNSIMIETLLKILTQVCAFREVF